MRIFPIGTIAAASSQGTMDGISYDLFEPNVNCISQKVRNILETKFQDQSIQQRKKAEAYMLVNYFYQNIFTREYRQIEHFSDVVEESFTSFYLIDWSRGHTPTNVASAAQKWVVSIDDTRSYSTITNEKSNKAILWDGNNWKEGDVDAITQNVSVSLDVFTDNYGDLTLARAGSSTMVYPLYQVYMMKDTMKNFRPGVYWEEDIKTGEPGGYMYSGNISFVTKYKV